MSAGWVEQVRPAASVSSVSRTASCVRPVENR